MVFIHWGHPSDQGNPNIRRHHGYWNPNITGSIAITISQYGNTGSMCWPWHFSMLFSCFSLQSSIHNRPHPAVIAVDPGKDARSEQIQVHLSRFESWNFTRFRGDQMGPLRNLKDVSPLLQLKGKLQYTTAEKDMWFDHPQYLHIILDSVTV